MLIDSGADVTLLPRSAVERLGLSGTKEGYRMEAYDGSSAEAESVQAVLVLVGLRFRGRFLLIDGEVGIIGRNILNRLRVILDGPSLCWDVVE